MAVLHVVAGPVTCSFDSNVLGLTRDGADIRYELRSGDVFSDDFGGAGGAPADTQVLGMVGSVNLELTKYDTAEVEKLNAFTSGGVAGFLPPLGTLIRQENNFGTLLLTGSIKTYTFEVAFPREPQSLNAGTKFSSYLVQFEFWINDPTSRQFVSIT